jgi:predicted transcriptional regulator
MSTTSFRMDVYIEREQIRQKMLRETEEALVDLEANRLLSGEEVMKWLETWGTDHEIEAPKL